MNARKTQRLEFVHHLVKFFTLEENWVFVTNQFVTTCDYLSFATIIGYFFNDFLHLVVLATTLQLSCN
jgi:hypothetical protein